MGESYPQLLEKVMKTATAGRMPFILSAMLLVCLLATPSQAQAGEIVVYNFTSDHCTGTCGTPPFGTVTLEQNGTDVDFLVHLFDPSYFVKTGAGDYQAFMFNATGVVLGDITVDPHTPVLAATAGAYSNGAGTFAFGIWCPGCNIGGNTTSGDAAFNADIAFTVANASIADVTVPNLLGNVFAADILGNNGLTGVVDASTVTVPDGGMTLMLLGGALVGLGALRRKFNV
jgi:hypothetical protein